MTRRPAVLLPFLLASFSIVAALRGQGGPRPTVATPTQFAEWTSRGYPSFGVRDSSAVVAGDVDSDGDLDAVVANFSGDSNRLYINDGRGQLFDETASRLPTPAGLATFDLELADVDGDADLDLLLGTGATSPTRLYLNDGAGRYTDVSAQQMPAVLRTNQVLVPADFDGDGDLDLVVGDGFGLPAELYLNDGRGTFVPAPAGALPPVQGSQCGMIAADVDGDGDHDLVLANCGISQNQLFLNDGAATFSDVTATAFPVRLDASFDVDAGDVDADGDVDLVFGALQSNQLYLNVGGGVFEAASAARFPVDSDNSHVVVLVDVESDGDLDVVFGNESFPGQDRLYLNDGLGVFIDVTSTHMPTEVEGTEGIAVADFDQNGAPDLLTVNGKTGNGSPNHLFLNNGAGVFSWPGQPPLPVSLFPPKTNAVALADFDADGDADALLGDRSAGNRLQINDGTGSLFQTSSGLPQRTETTAAFAVGDVDRDGDPDVIVGNMPRRYGYGYSVTGGQNRLYLNDGAGAFVDATDPGLPSALDWTAALALGDLDMDGDLDLVLGRATTTPAVSRRNAVYANDGAGRFVPLPDDLPPDFDETRALALRDFDGDGDLDLVAGNRRQSRLYRNDGTGRFDPAPLGLPSRFDDTYALVAGDVDGDGDDDLVLGNRGQSRLYINDGSGTFADVTFGRLPPDDTDTRALALLDYDEDGDLDLAVGTLTTNRLWENDGAGTFTDVTSAVLPPDAQRTLGLAVADLDGDGDVDLVASNDGNDRLYLNLQRQLRAPRYATVGRAHDFEIYARRGAGAPGGSGVVLLGPSLAPAPIPLGALGALYLQPPVVPLPVVGLGAAGVGVVTVGIPAVAMLWGVELDAQAAVLDGVGRLGLTGYVTERIR
ncbi:MAG: VCBS repeat-containing protein [Planctomycetota bacterium]